MTIKIPLAFSILLILPACSAFQSLGRGVVSETAPPEPLRIAQLGYGKEAHFIVCSADCPQRTTKTIWLPPQQPPIANVPPVSTPPLASPPLPENRTAVVYFASGKAALDDKATKIVADILDEARKTKRIVVTGYTDPTGSKTYNDKLAQRRAESVKHFLVKGGIKAGLIEIVQGMANSHDKKRRAENRRATVELLYTLKETK